MICAALPKTWIQIAVLGPTLSSLVAPLDLIHLDRLCTSGSFLAVQDLGGVFLV
jgi:hypothetical protein